MNPQEKFDLDKIVRVVSACAKVEEVVLFGSRANGTHRPSSDWDISLKGSNLGLSDVLSLQVQIDDLWLPSPVDIVIHDSIENLALREHIDRVGQVVWRRIETS